MVLYYGFRQKLWKGLSQPLHITKASSSVALPQISQALQFKQRQLD
jgi:hypothetical protein